MKLFLRCAILGVAALALAGCQTDGKSHKVGRSIAKAKMSGGTSWQSNLAGSFQNYHGEPEEPNWSRRAGKKKSKRSRSRNRRYSRKRSRSRSRSRIGSIRQMARRLAPAGVNVSSLSRMVGKRRQAKISCIPADLRMILNTVAWHYGKRVHIQSGFRSKRHNRRVGGARRSFHMSCQAVDIQVSGINKYKLAKFLKSLPGRGGVGTYCNNSTVHIDIGPRRAWHYGCGNKSKARRRLARYKKKKRRRRHRSYK